VDWVIGTFNATPTDKIDTNANVTAVLDIQQTSISSVDLNVTTINTLFSSVLTNKFSAGTVTAGFFSTSDEKTFVAIDGDGSGTFTSGDYLINVTGSIISGVTTSTFI
jgi:hypothetical protein